jgi:uncharacterized protein YdcH (DUF465 family)
MTKTHYYHGKIDTMLCRLIILLMLLLLSACASNRLIQTDEEFNTSKNEAAVKVHLKTADAHFSELKNLQAHSSFPEEFNKIKNKFSQLMKLLENNQVQEAIQQEPELIELMIQLEIKSLKKNHLEEAVNYIQEAKNLDAEDYAPNSLKQTEGLLLSTQELIEKSYRDRHAIAQQSKRTLSSAKKLFYIAKETRAIHKQSNEELEQQMVNHYSFLVKLGDALELKPLDIQDYSSQRDNLLEQIKNKVTLAKKETPAPQQSIQAQEVVQQIKPEPAKVIISHETNKAVLPELFFPKGYSDNEAAEQDLEFDSVEIVK